MPLADWLFDKGKKGTYGFAQGATRGNTGNSGLWFDRFGTVWATPRELGPSKIEWAKALKGPVGRKPEIEAYAERVKRLTTKMHGAFRDCALPDLGRFVTGVGIQHPIENGFAWHPTLGTPYLPGSGVKGMVHAWARDWGGAGQVDLKRIFGVGAAESDAGLGSVIFLDAIPVEVPTLSVEVMTPHGPGSGAPEDAGKPLPIGFLAVRTATFRFSVLPATSCGNAQAADDVRCALSWLTAALAELGAGAKTKSGYGRFN